MEIRGNVMTVSTLSNHERRRAEEFLRRTAAQCAAWSAMGLAAGLIAGVVAGVLG
jgi:hypothetical protein